LCCSLYLCLSLDFRMYIYKKIINIYISYLQRIRNWSTNWWITLCPAYSRMGCSHIVLPFVLPALMPCFTLKSGNTSHYQDAIHYLFQRDLHHTKIGNTFHSHNAMRYLFRALFRSPYSTPVDPVESAPTAQGTPQLRMCALSPLSRCERLA
jgi:hypothetical protein